MKIDSKAILAEVRANIARLNNCLGPHDFQPVPPPKGRMVRDFRCTRCGGTVDSIRYLWYTRGLEHGRQHPAE